MTAIAPLRAFAHAATCDKCGNTLIAPECTEYFSEEHLVLNLWSCTSCGNRFETEVFDPVEAKPKSDHQVLEDDYPSLVA